MPDDESRPRVLPVEQVVSEMGWWLERGWPIPDPKIDGVLAELGWRREADEPRRGFTGHQFNDPDASVVSEGGFLYRVDYKVTDFVRPPTDLSEAEFRRFFAAVVVAMAERYGTGVLGDLENPGVGWVARPGAMVRVTHGKSSSTVWVYSPLAEFNWRVSDAEDAAEAALNPPDVDPVELVSGWSGLVDRLMVVLGSFEPGMRLIVSSVEDDRRFVQFGRFEDGPIIGEFPGPVWVPAADWGRVSSLLRWELEPRDGLYSTSVVLPGPAGVARAVAEDAVVVLREVFGIAEPGELQYRSWREPATFDALSGYTVNTPGLDPFPLKVLGLAYVKPEPSQG